MRLISIGLYTKTYLIVFSISTRIYFEFSMFFTESKNKIYIILNNCIKWYEKYEKKKSINTSLLLIWSALNSKFLKVATHTIEKKKFVD